MPADIAQTGEETTFHDLFLAMALGSFPASVQEQKAPEGTFCEVYSVENRVSSSFLRT